MTTFNPPKQGRSRRTLERILEAALDILEAEGPAGVTVQAVVARAGSSVGSFYARFRGKDDLLEYLGARAWDEALGRWNEAVAARSWSDGDLPGVVAGAVDLLVDARLGHVGQLRALDRMSEDSDAYEAFRAHLLAGLQGFLLEHRGEIGHGNPELAVRLGLRAVLGAIDGALEGEGEEEPVSIEELAQECRELLLGYLARGSGAGGQGVDFFEVWG